MGTKTARARASKAVIDYESPTLSTDLEGWKKEDLQDYLRHSTYIFGQ